jgi:hypothetical protein
MNIKIEHLTDFWAHGGASDTTNRVMVGEDGKIVAVFEVAKIVDGCRVSIAKAISVVADETGKSGPDWGELLGAEMMEKLGKVRL